MYFRQLPTAKAGGLPAAISRESSIKIGIDYLSISTITVLKYLRNAGVKIRPSRQKTKEVVKC